MKFSMAQEIERDAYCRRQLMMIEVLACFYCDSFRNEVISLYNTRLCYCDQKRTRCDEPPPILNLNIKSDMIMNCIATDEIIIHPRYSWKHNYAVLLEHLQSCSESSQKKHEEISDCSFLVFKNLGVCHAVMIACVIQIIQNEKILRS